MKQLAGWRWLSRAGVIVRLAGIAGGVVLLLRSAESTVPAEAVEVTVHVRGGLDQQAMLVRQADRWLGQTADFPPDSVAHVQVSDSPGFFLVHEAGGSFHAISDRSPHRGQPLEFRDPLPGTASHADGPRAGFYDAAFGANHTLDGEPFAGPAPRPLDPFPLAVEGERIEIATRALCPPDLGVPPPWCGAGAGPRALAAGQVVVFLPPGSQLVVLGGPAAGTGRRLGEAELRAWGAEVVLSRPEMERLAAGARVLWLHRDALPLVDPVWVRRQYDQGRAVGVLDGTMADLQCWFGLGDNRPSWWIQPGSGRPVFAQVHAHDVHRRQQRSDWLTLSWFLTASRAAMLESSP